MGRVLLNLYNNAFYEVAEKKKQHPEGYERVVSVTTKRTGQKVLISIKDKPTGQGTGLGLSLSYDIVKVHKGEIRVDSKEGEFTEFVVQIPIT
jgi:two-component system, NtrC family, sensor kinase